jgi:hypothetical protein
MPLAVQTAPTPLQIEQRRGVFGILEDVGCGLVDRDRACAGHGIRTLPGMQAQGLEGGRLGCGHGDLNNDAVRPIIRTAAPCATKAPVLLAHFSCRDRKSAFQPSRAA